MDINTLTQSYYTDIILSIILIITAILLSKFLSSHFRKRTSKRARTLLILILIFVLVLSILVELWKDQNAFINQLAIYKDFMPGYDTIILIIAAAVFSHFLQIWLSRHSSDMSQDLSKRHKIKLVARWVSWGFFFLATAIIFLIKQGWGNTGTFLGLIGAGLALSLQETILCFIGWLHIIFNHTYDIGDRIEVNGMLGDVIGINTTHTRLLEVSMKTQGGQSTGRIMTIPNSQVFRGSVLNSTCGFPFIWLEVITTVTFESDVDLAIETIMRIAEKSPLKIEPEVMNDITLMQDDYAIHYRHLTPMVYSRIVNSGIELTLRFLSPVRSARQRENDISLSILREFNEIPQIEIAYPTSRLYRRNEGKYPEYQPPVNK